MWAARRGDTEKVRTLIDFGADVSKRDRIFISPLEKAVADGNDACVRLLLEDGASPNTTAGFFGVTPMHQVFFCPHDRTDTLTALIEAGADVNSCDVDGWTPLFWAAGRNGPGVLTNARFLIENGANVNHVDAKARALAFLSLTHNDMALLRILVACGARLDFRTLTGRTILHITVSSAGLEEWAELTEWAKQGKLHDVDLNGLHEGHDVWHCFEKCRNDSYTGPRATEQEERQALSALLSSVEEETRVSTL